MNHPSGDRPESCRNRPSRRPHLREIRQTDANAMIISIPEGSEPAGQYSPERSIPLTATGRGPEGGTHTPRISSVFPAFVRAFPIHFLFSGSRSPIARRQSSFVEFDQDRRTNFLQFARVILDFHYLNRYNDTGYLVIWVIVGLGP